LLDFYWILFLTGGESKAFNLMLSENLWDLLLTECESITLKQDLMFAELLWNLASCRMCVLYSQNIIWCLLKFYGILFLTECMFETQNLTNVWLFDYLFLHKMVSLRPPKPDLYVLNLFLIGREPERFQMLDIC